MQLWQFLAPIQARVHPLVYFRHGQCCGPARRSFHLNWPNLVASASPPPPLTPTDVVCWLSSVRVAVNSVAVVRCIQVYLAICRTTAMASRHANRQTVLKISWSQLNRYPFIYLTGDTSRTCCWPGNHVRFCLRQLTDLLQVNLTVE